MWAEAKRPGLVVAPLKNVKVPLVDSDGRKICTVMVRAPKMCENKLRARMIHFRVLDSYVD